MGKRPCCLAAVGFLFGVIACRYAKTRFIVVCLALAACFLAAYCGRKNRGVWRFVMSALVLLGFALGALRCGQNLREADAALSGVVDGGEICLQGKLTKKEYKNEKYLYYLSSCVAGTDRNRIILPVKYHRILVYFDSDRISVGETIVIKGNVSLWETARNEGNYDQQAYYSAQGILFAVENAEVTKTCGGACAWKEKLYRLKLRLHEVYAQMENQEAAGILATMILGDKTLLDADVKRIYQIGGISHILAISGLHISVIGMTLYRRLRGFSFPYLPAAAAAAVVMYGYGEMIGMGTSVSRALIMFFLSLGADVFGRGYDSFQAMGAAALALLWKNPLLFGDAGFQLSFAAVGAAVLASRYCAARRNCERMENGAKKEKGAKTKKELEKATETKKDTKTNKRAQAGESERAGKRTQAEKNAQAGKRALRLRETCRDTLTVSAAIQLVTLPICAWYYYEISTYAILVNLLLLPMTGAILGMGIVGGVAGLASKTISYLLLLPATALLQIQIAVCERTALLPNASLITGKPSLGQLALYYIVLAAVAVFAGGGIKRRAKAAEFVSDGQTADGENMASQKGQPTVRGDKVPLQKEKASARGRKLRRFVCAGILAGNLLLLLLTPRVRGFELDMLDVGQGDACYLHTEDGTSLFFDGGSSNISKAGSYRILPFLKAKGVRQIDCWVVSHTDADHISGLKEVIEAGYPIRRLIVGCNLEEGSFDAPVTEEEEGQQSETLEKQESLVELARQAGIEVIYLQAGDVLHLSGATLTALSPKREEITGDANEDSLVILYEENDFAGLFCGDIGETTEHRLAAAGALSDVDFYKAAHHGSNYSNTEAFLEAISPEITVISCSRTNTYGHPGAEAVARIAESGSRIYYTMEGGQIMLRTEGGQVTVREWGKERAK